MQEIIGILTIRSNVSKNHNMLTHPQASESSLSKESTLTSVLLRQSGAAKLTRSLPIDAPVDCFVSKLALEGIHLKALALVRPIAFQNRELKSDIAHSGMLRHGFGGGGGGGSNGGSL